MSKSILGQALLYRKQVLDIYRYIRPLLFALPAEAAHAATLSALKSAHQLGLLSVLGKQQLSTPVSLMGLQFRNRLGLAAGLDKSATCIDALGALGFGFIEIGTVTPRPQAGNARPRLFRLSDDHALINRMGFPNDGVVAVVARLRKRRYDGVCGVSIGKNAATRLQDAASDYVACLAAVYSCADYVAVNVSSPNTSELRRLQHGDSLKLLLTVLLEARAALVRESGRHVAILVKLSADLVGDELVDAAKISLAYGIDGIIATNTSVHREGLAHVGMEEGGLSGAPLIKSAVRAVQCIRAEVGSKFPIVGVGGIDSAERAMAMRAAGADLLQIYTGLIYRGPRLIREILASRANV
jgi:dihydroorotate dehydrogenase